MSDETSTPAGPSAPSAVRETVGDPEVVATFPGPMPTGVTVSHRGRLFVNFPRWGDEVPFTVAEVRDSEAVAYPDPHTARFDLDDQPASLVSVQSVVVDPADRLWVLDTGSPQFAPTTYGGPKLVCVDLDTDRVVQTILVPPDVALPTTYLNDVRFDLRRGEAGLAFITDSSRTGPNGIIVVDLATGRSWRRLTDHPSTKADRDLIPVAEGRPMRVRPRPGLDLPVTTGADGIAISADGRTLYYCPFIGRRLYAVSVDALADPDLPEDRVAATVVDLGDKGGCSDGLESDAQGRVYATSWEHDAVLRRSPEGRWDTVLAGPAVSFPDTLALATDGHLYVTANQLHRQPPFHEGADLRRPPYAVLRVPVDGTPVLLR